MANPKRRFSKHAKRTRRAAWNSKFELPTIGKCSNCDEMKIAHHVCGSCGHYNNRLVIHTNKD
jgi:large subunit ribosomal protein L32